MGRKFLLWSIWLIFTGYTAWLAPLDQPDTWSLLQKLLTFQLGSINAYLVAIFWLMGVWPMIYACLMFVDGRMQQIPAWPYFLASNGSGVIGLIPYLGLRDRNQTFSGQKDRWLELLDSHRMGAVLSLTTAGLIAYALLVGDWGDFVHQWQTEPFVHLISLDFCLMCLVFPLTSLFNDDMARRDFNDARIFWIVALVPLFGPLAYLCVRPPLQNSVQDREAMPSHPVERF
jgi:hypothetical protein